jgi:hypothetical protein
MYARLVHVVVSMQSSWSRVAQHRGLLGQHGMIPKPLLARKDLDCHKQNIRN